jgi:hypothetical protein
MPPADTPLYAETMIDLAHESLIRVWQKLRSWTDEEAASARTYKRLDETATLHQEEKVGLWRDIDLQLALDWRERNRPSKDWAQRYGRNFDLAMGFLEQSRQAVAAEALEKERQRQRELKRTRIFAAILALAFLVAAFLAWIAREQQRRAQESDKTNRQLYYVVNLNLAQIAFNEGNYIRSQELLNEFLPSASQSAKQDIRSFA